MIHMQKQQKGFFTAIQNKFHYAIHVKTAAELIVDRANHKTKNMGLITWEGFPDSKIYKYDVVVAKKYLNEEELNQM